MRSALVIVVYVVLVLLDYALLNGAVMWIVAALLSLAMAATLGRLHRTT